MKLVSIEEFRANVDAYIASLADGDVVLTRDGTPCAMLCSTPAHIPVADCADEFDKSPEFWRMIGDRRERAAISWDESLKQLEL